MATKLNRKRKYNRTKRLRTHGFLKRMKSKSGAKVISRRRAKGRHKLAVVKK